MTELANPYKQDKARLLLYTELNGNTSCAQDFKNP